MMFNWILEVNVLVFILYNNFGQLKGVYLAVRMYERLDLWNLKSLGYEIWHADCFT